MSSLALYLFGKPRLEQNGELLTLPSKGLPFLAYLAAEQTVERKELARLLWPESPNPDGNLRQLLFKLRDTAVYPYLHITNQAITLTFSETDFVDIKWFCHHIALADIDNLLLAVELYQEEFLRDFSFKDDERYFDEWLYPRRQQYYDMVMELLTTLTHHYLQTAGYSQAERMARRQLALDSFHEPAMRGVMQALAAAGQPTQALAEFHTFQHQLQEELGVQPSRETVAVYEEIGERVARETAVYSPDHEEKRILLDRVRTSWIDDVLKNSLNSTNLIPLQTTVRPDTLFHSWNTILNRPQMPSRKLASNNSILDTYNDFGRALLILGEPGSGKTTLLLHLTELLITEAEKKVTERIPVVFNLRSWAEQEGELEEWLIIELGEKYRIHRKLAAEWVGSDQLQILLDGLDEVPNPQRLRCVKAINTYRLAHALAPMVVCSRTHDYEAIGEKVSLDWAIQILPLTDEQVSQYLYAINIKLQTIPNLQTNEILQELVRSPLMLSILTLTYQDEDGIQLPEAGTTITEVRQLIFSKYVDRMLQWRKNSWEIFPAAKTKQWLCYLAQAMTRQNQTIFLIEQMQPFGLQFYLQRLFYFFTTRIVSVLILMCTLLAAVYVQNELLGFREGPPIVYSQLIGQIGISSLMAGSLLSIVDLVHYSVRQWQRQNNSRDKGWQHLLRGLLFTAIIALIFIFTQVILFTDQEGVKLTSNQTRLIFENTLQNRFDSN